jgi:hypothetical protein
MHHVHGCPGAKAPIEIIEGLGTLRILDIYNVYLLSLKTLCDNYAALIEFIDNISKEKNENGAKASGITNIYLILTFYFIRK